MSRLNTTHLLYHFLPFVFVALFASSNAFSSVVPSEFGVIVRDENIKTILLHPSSSELSPPIIPLDGEATLMLQFDDLSEDIREMTYSFRHCTYDWEISDLQEMDYLKGFNNNIISDYEFSFNTLVPYTHYRLEFPNDLVSFTRSGNYLLEVYAEGRGEEPIFTGRFMLTEEVAHIRAEVRRSSVVSEREYRQELEVEVNLNNISLMNPYDEVKLVVLQNLRRDNAITDIEPRFVKNNQLIYDFHDSLSFDAGNEYRHFDAKSIRYRTEEIDKIVEEGGIYHVYLMPDEPLGFKSYSFENDLNGKFLIKNDDMSDSHLESDYIMVHFTLPVPAMLGNGTVYIYGQLSRWRPDEDFAMEYDSQDMVYKKSILLKQGYYNYAYLFQPRKGGPADFERLEGNHSETENSYTVLVYYRDRSAFSDRLLGVTTVNSIRSGN